ncbi:MAG: putative hydrolase YxeP [Phycisphaerae bacterium]|nr:putative hydrolase YxeP [Phycisphaerae bacterium]
MKSSHEFILEDARLLSGKLVSWRRHLHAHPELSGQEAQTAGWVAQQMRELGYRPVTGVGGVHGVTAVLEAGDGPEVALRADMDALPIQEETGLEFASQSPGVMHACGHDAHTAMLLGAAEILARRRGELRNPVRFIFQPSEEVYPGGAAPMIAGGVLENVTSILGLHIWSNMAAGKIGTRTGAMMASVNRLRITVRGRGGHAAAPHECVDPIVIASQIVLALQTVVSRGLSMSESAVVSITQINAGTADNVIPPAVEMVGTIRTLDGAVRQRVCERVRAIAEGVARSFGGSAEVGAEPGYPVLVNDDEATQRGLRAARRLVGLEKIEIVEPIGGGEDFAYYGQHVPAVFMFVGARNEGKQCVYPHHHPRFNVDEDALPLGVALYAQYCLERGSGE